MLLGLLASGVTRTEGSAQQIVKMLLARQHSDGGWGLEAGKSDALRPARRSTPQDGGLFRSGSSRRSRHPLPGQQARAERGLAHLQERSGRRRKAETMWAVLGLVTVDVSSLAVLGLVDGQHVEPQMKLAVSATDNGGGGIRKLEILVDDLPVASGCGAKLEHVLDGSKLASGKALIDPWPKRQGADQPPPLRGSRRRGLLTDVGARFDEGSGTSIVSLRNIAPQAEQAGAVELEVFKAEGGSEAKPGARVFHESKKGSARRSVIQLERHRQRWQTAVPRALPGQALVPRWCWSRASERDGAFVHRQRGHAAENFAEVEGQISLRGGANWPIRSSSWSMTRATSCSRPAPRIRATIASRRSIGAVPRPCEETGLRGSRSADPGCARRGSRQSQHELVGSLPYPPRPAGW